MTKIVTLGPVTTTTATSFEEAFGEYSEVRGRGRARRASRVADRQQKRKERKLGRVAARDEVKGARQESRIGRRATRKERRQAMRDAQQLARQGRKDTRLEKRQDRQDTRAERSQDRRDMRTERRMGRRDMRNPEEENVEQGLDTGIDQEMNDGTQGGYAPSGTSQGGGSSQGGGYDDQGGGYDDQGGYGDQGGYDDQGGYADEGGAYDTVGAGPQGGGNYQGQGPAVYGEDEMPYDEVGSEDYGDEGYADDSEGGDETYGDDGGYLMDYQASEDYNFDGVMGAEDRFAEIIPEKTSPRVQRLADEYVVCKGTISNLEGRRYNCGDPFERQDISRRIIENKKRLQELKSSLEGESYADGSDNRKEIHNAMKKAHHKYKNRHRRHSQATRVQSNLNPSFSPNRIVVPGKSNADGTPTGLNGLDLMNDYDAPRVREIQLGADGSQSSKGLGWGAVIGGIAIAAIAFWAVDKYKLLK